MESISTVGLMSQQDVSSLKLEIKLPMNSTRVDSSNRSDNTSDNSSISRISSSISNNTSTTTSPVSPVTSDSTVTETSHLNQFPNGSSIIDSITNSGLTIPSINNKTGKQSIVNSNTSNNSKDNSKNNNCHNSNNNRNVKNGQFNSSCNNNSSSSSSSKTDTTMKRTNGNGNGNGNSNTSDNKINSFVDVKKCAWCDKPRARNDLCNRCRQKVESRARRLMEQKIAGDIAIIRELTQYLRKNIDLNKFNAQEYQSIFESIFPLLVCLR